MNKQTALFLYKLACRLLAGVLLIYMTVTLYDYLNIDPIGYLPSVGQWLVGLFWFTLFFINLKGWQQSLNLLFLTGLAGLASIY